MSSDWDEIGLLTLSTISELHCVTRCGLSGGMGEATQVSPGMCNTSLLLYQKKRGEQFLSDCRVFPCRVSLTSSSFLLCRRTESKRKLEREKERERGEREKSKGKTSLAEKRRRRRGVREIRRAKFVQIPQEGTRQMKKNKKTRRDF